MALFWGLFSYLALKILSKGTKSKIFTIPLLLSAVFTSLEYLRTLSFSIIFFGSGGLIGPHWTIGNLAYLIPFKPFLKISSLGGIYAINFIGIFLISTFILLIFSRLERKRYFIPLTAVVLFILVISIYPQKEQPVSIDEIPIAIIQTQKPAKIFHTPDELLNYFNKEIELLKKSSENRVKIIIFPEGTNFSKTLLNFADPQSAQDFFNRTFEKEVLIIDSSRTLEGESFKSTTISISSKNGLLGSYDKLLLTPGGEFIPYIYKFPISIIYPKAKRTFDTYSDFARGDSPPSLNYKNYDIKTFVCSDLLSPGITSSGDSDFIIGQNSLSLFKGNSLLESQLLSIYRYRAAENNKYLAIASNFGHSYIINNKGIVEKSTDSIGYQILTGDIVPNDDSTWYNKLGDWPILLISLAILGLGPGTQTRVKYRS